MFTGIIEEMGTVVAVKTGQQAHKLQIKGGVIFDDLKLGDSVAVNGVCLTVSHLGDKVFSADIMNETLHRSALRGLAAGDKVNLERAMAAGGRFGGHMVSGHIDDVGTIRAIRRDDNAIWYTIATEPAVMRGIVEKGSITVDGISLTVAAVEAESFQVSIIPHTAANTVLGGKKPGDRVNLENDIVGKYIEKYLGLQASGSKPKSTLTAELLLKSGF